MSVVLTCVKELKIQLVIISTDMLSDFNRTDLNKYFVTVFIEVEGSV